MSADLSVQATGQRTVDARNTARGDTRTAPNAQAAQAATQAAQNEPSHADAQKAVAAANTQLQQIDSELTFQLDHDTGRVVVKLIDRKTNQVLRQMPTKEALAIAKALGEGCGTGRIVKTDA